MDSARVRGEESERDALMVRRSLREGSASSWLAPMAMARPWSLGAAAFRGGVEEESVWEWRKEWGVKRNETKEEGVAGQAL